MTELQEHVESLLGQFCYAFGAGAAGTRVHSATIRALQRRYRPYLVANLGAEGGRADWDSAKYHLLEYVTTMGRYSADLALESGDVTIMPEHFETAAMRFEAAAHRTRARAIKAGKWCPGGQSSDYGGPTQREGELRRGPWAQPGA